METGQLLQGDATQELAKENQITLLQLNTQEVARQLTLKDFDLLRKVDSREYIYEVWEFPPELWSNLSKFQEIVNRETFWVVTEICSEPNVVKRMKLIKHFIKIARHCKGCKNFNSTFAIISGLSNMTVRRLKSTWDKLPTRYNKIYEDLENLMDPSRSMFKYRSLLNNENVTPPLIPFFPVVKRDLTLIYLNNKSVIDGLINFEKLRMIAREVRQVVKCHSVHYDPACMFDSDVNSVRGSAPQSMTSQVVGMVTSSTTWARRSLARDQNPKKVYEEAVMARRVNQYLDDLLVILDEDKLREMSNACENPQGSAPSSVQTRRKNSPTTSPLMGKKEKRNGGKVTDPSPLASRSDRFQADRISISSTTSTSSSIPEVLSPKPSHEPVEEVFESDSSSLRGEKYALDTRQPDNQQQDVRHADTRHHDVRQSDTRHQDVRHSDTRHQDIRQSDTRHQNVRHEDMRHSDIRQQDMRQPTQDLRQKELRQPDMRYPDDRHPTQDIRHADFRQRSQDVRQQPHYSDNEFRYTQTRETVETRKTYEYSASPDSYTYQGSYDDVDVVAGPYHRGRYCQQPPKYTVEYIQEYDDSDEGQVSAV